MKKFLFSMVLLVVLTSSSVLASANTAEGYDAILVEMTPKQIELNALESTYVDDISVNLPEDTYADAGAELVEMTQEQINANNETPDFIDEMIPINPRARADNKPVEVWNLDGKPYTATFNSGAYITKSYTNYYFNPNKNGVIWVPIDLLKCGGKITVTCYEVSSDREVSKWTGDVPVSKSNIKFTGLSRTKHYYFKFTCGIFDGISGSTEINNNL